MQKGHVVLLKITTGRAFTSRATCCAPTPRCHGAHSAQPAPGTGRPCTSAARLPVMIVRQARAAPGSHAPPRATCEMAVRRSLDILFRVPLPYVHSPSERFQPLMAGSSERMIEIGAARARMEDAVPPLGSAPASGLCVCVCACVCVCPFARTALRRIVYAPTADWGDAPQPASPARWTRR